MADFAEKILMSSPPLKIPFAHGREREFLYIQEVDALIAALTQTRSPIRNSALAVLLFCQALQPSELCWLRVSDVNFTDHNLLVVRNRSKSVRHQSQINVNFLPLSNAEVNLLKQLSEERSTDWLFASERKQRLSERSLHHLIQQAGVRADLPVSIHPYMLRRSGIYFRAALLLQPLGLSLRQCCLLWKWHFTKVPISTQEQQQYSAIDQLQESAFLAILSQLKAFVGIKVDDYLIDYLLGAFLLFPRLQNIPQNHWLVPSSWQPKTLPKRLKNFKT